LSSLRVYTIKQSIDENEIKKFLGDRNKGNMFEWIARGAREDSSTDIDGRLELLEGTKV